VFSNHKLQTNRRNQLGTFQLTESKGMTMQIDATQLAEDRDRIFDDWGEPVTLRQVTQSFVPETQQIAEDVVESMLTGIVGTSPTQPVPDSRGHAHTIDLVVRVKSEEFPAAEGDISYRIVSNGTEYDVISQSQPAGLAVRDLVCRRIA
jgi:hypothetical protein